MAGTRNLAASSLFTLMREPSPTVRASSVLVVLLFFAAAAAISFLSLQRGTDYITLTINAPKSMRDRIIALRRAANNRDTMAA